MGINYLLVAALILVPATLLFLFVYRNKVHRAVVYGLRSFKSAGSKITGMIPRNNKGATSPAAKKSSVWGKLILIGGVIIIFMGILWLSKHERSYKLWTSNTFEKEHGWVEGSTYKKFQWFDQKGADLPEHLAEMDSLHTYSIRGKDNLPRPFLMVLHHDGGNVDTFDSRRKINPEITSDVRRITMYTVKKESAKIIYSVYTVHR